MPPSFEYLQGWRSHHFFELVLVKISWSSFFFPWFLIRISWVSALVHCFSSFQCGSLRSLLLPLPHSPHGVVGYSLGLLFWRHPITSVTSTSHIPVHQTSQFIPAAQTLVWLLSSSIKPFTLLSDSRMYQRYCFCLLFVDWCVIWAANQRGSLSQAMFTPVYTCLHFPQYLDNRIVNM